MNDWNTRDWEVIWDELDREKSEFFRPNYNAQFTYAPDEMIYHVRNGGSITYRIPAENVIRGHRSNSVWVDDNIHIDYDEVESAVSRMFGVYNFKNDDAKPLKPVSEKELMEVLNL